MAAAVGTEIIYGCSFVFTKHVTGTVDPFTLLGWRFVLAFAILVVLMAARVVRVRVTRATLWPLLVLAAFQPVVYYIGETYGVAATTASESGLIIAAIPVFMMLAATIILRRHPARHQVTGIAISLVGVVVTVVAGGLSASFNAFGYVLLLVAVVAYALYAVFADRFAHGTTDMDKTFVMVASGALLFGTVAVARHASDRTLETLVRLPLTDPAFTVAVVYLAAGSTIGAFFLQNLAIRSIGSTRYSTFIGLSTATTLVTGGFFLGERLSWAQLAGGAVIIAGVYVANRKGRGPSGRGFGKGTKRDRSLQNSVLHVGSPPQCGPYPVRATLVPGASVGHPLGTRRGFKPVSDNTMIIIIISSIVAFSIVMSFFTRWLLRKFFGNDSSKQKAQGWPLVIGTLNSIQQTGMFVNEQPQCLLTIPFTTLQGQRVTGTVKKVLALTQLASFQPGLALPLRYNPAQPDKIALALDADPNELQQAQAQYGLAMGTTTQEALNVANNPNRVNAQGIILSAQPTGRIVNGLTEMALRIMVTRPDMDGTRYEATITKNVPQAVLPQLAVGSIVQVTYVPTDEQNIALSLNAGTIATVAR